MLRYDLLKIPMVRRFLRSKLWPEDINFGWVSLLCFSSWSQSSAFCCSGSAALCSKLRREQINCGVGFACVRMQLTRASASPPHLVCRFTVYAFAFLVGLLFIGPQDR